MNLKDREYLRKLREYIDTQIRDLREDLQEHLQRECVALGGHKMGDWVVLETVGYTCRGYGIHSLRRVCTVCGYSETREGTG